MQDYVYRFPRRPLVRLSGKYSTGVMVAYAARYREQKIPHGSVRQRVALHRSTPSRAGKTGTPQVHGLRVILNAVFYVLKSGCPWRLLARDFPPWKTVYDWFRRWRIDGTWERLNAGLRERLRSQVGRDPHPSAGIVDATGEAFVYIAMTRIMVRRLACAR
jgi:transposase